MIIDTLSTLGYFFGIDILFWAWAVVTILAFIDLFLPDPIPYIDEIVQISGSIILLVLLAIRGTSRLFFETISIAANPFVVSFIVALAILLLFGYIRKRVKK